VEQDRGPLPRRLNKPDKAQKAFEKALSLDRQIWRGRGLIPMYERQDAKRLAAVLQVQLEHTKDAADRQERMLRTPRFSG